MTNYVARASDLAGGPRALAETLGVTRQFIQRCMSRGWMPIERARQVEELYGIEREKLVKPVLRDFIMEG